MSNLLKYIEHGATYFITSRTEEGLPFLPSKRFNRIFKSIMARAQELYPVDIIGADLSANHLHQMLRAINPVDLPLFVGYVKQELSHAVNRITGRRKKTIWADGYDSPVLVRPQEIFYYLAYLYTQAQDANQADTIEESDHPNTWNMFMSGQHTEVYKRLYRTDFWGRKDENDEELKDRQEHTLILSPYAWLKRAAPQMTEAEAKEAIIRAVREEEARLRQIREQEGIKIYRGETSPERAASYVPKKFGKRSVCICWDTDILDKFMNWYRAQVAECRRILLLWRKGDRREPWPPGFFPPNMPVLSAAMPG